MFGKLTDEVCLIPYVAHVNELVSFWHAVFQNCPLADTFVHGKPCTRTFLPPDFYILLNDKT